MKNTDRDTQMLMVKWKLTISLVVHTKKRPIRKLSTSATRNFLSSADRAPRLENLFSIATSKLHLEKPWSRLRHNLPCPHALLQKLQGLENPKTQAIDSDREPYHNRRFSSRTLCEKSSSSKQVKWKKGENFEYVDLTN